MGMSAGGSKGGPAADINMTPMIDVLLVLLIIFMVIQQELQKGVSVQVPPVEAEAAGESIDQIVLEVMPGGQFLLNQQPLNEQQLIPRLTEVFAPRPRKVIFVKGHEQASYGDIVLAVDASRASGIEVVGLVPRSPDAAEATPGA